MSFLARQGRPPKADKKQNNRDFLLPPTPKKQRKAVLIGI